MTRLLITGGTGFVGSRLVRRLSGAGYAITVSAIDPAESPFPEGIEYLVGDLAEGRAADRALSPWRWDAVVNLAGPVTRGEEDFGTGCQVVAGHVRIALQLMQHLPADWPGRVVHASSMTVYGHPDRLPVTEDHPRRPRHLYGLAKMLAEDVILAAPGVDAWVLRFPGLFSADRHGGALFHFMRAARAGTPIRITAPEPTCWDMLSVDDAIEAIARSLTASSRAPGAVNVSYGDPVELESVARWLSELAGAGSEIVNETGIQHPIFQLSNERARALLDWPAASLHERLRELYEAGANEVS